MGFNTVAFFLNDQSDQVEKDPDTIPRLRRALSSGSGYDGRQYMTVLPSQHADVQQIVIAGGNRITALGSMLGLSHDIEDVARYLADQCGYQLVKKAK